MVETPTPTIDKSCFGSVLLTRAISDSLPSPVIARLLDRHYSNDWGDQCEDDLQLNKEVVEAVNQGDQDPGRIFSCYKFPGVDESIYVITYPRPDGEYQSQPDYCYTTVMYASDY